MALRHPEPRHWNLDEFTRMVSAGVLGPDDRVELLEGEIVQRSPQNPPHATSVHKVKDALSAVYSTSRVRVASPLNLGMLSQPEPDVAVVEHGPEAYADQHPCSAQLIVEVSDASLEFDRSRKADIYAKGGVPEYWIVNIRQRRLEARRNPRPDGDSSTGYSYAVLTVLLESDTVSPLSQSGAELRVADLLP